MAITANTINYVSETIKKIENTMIVRIETVKINIDGDAGYSFSVFPNDSNQHPYVAIKDGKYQYHINESQILDLGIVAEPVTVTGKELKQKTAALHRQLNENLIKQLIAEDGTLLFDKDCDEDAKSVFILYRHAILERLKQSVLPQKNSQTDGGFRLPQFVMMGGGHEAGLFVMAIVLFSAVIIPLITISADLEDFAQSIKIQQSGIAIGTKLLGFGTLIAGAVMLVSANPIGGVLGFVLLSICALNAVAILYRSAKYLINYEHAPYSSLYVSQKQRTTLGQTNTEERVNTITYAIDTLVEKDKRLYGPEAKSRAPFWNEKNKIEHRNILNMVTQFKSSAADKYTQADIVKETVLVAADSILRIN